MSQTSNYSIPLLAEGAQDWKQGFDQILNALDQVIAKNQKPADRSLFWGDLTGGTYLEVDATGVKHHGPLNMLTNPTMNFVLESRAALPADGVNGQLIYLTTQQAPYIYAGGQWRPLGLLSGAAASISAIRYLGLVGTEEYTPNAIVYKRANYVTGNALARAVPTAHGEVMGWDSVNGVSSMVFHKISNWIGKQLQKGAFWIGTGPDTADSLTLPDTSNDTSPRLLAVDASTTHGVAWTEVKTLLPQAYKVAGEFLVGTANGGVFLSAPSADQVLVGDPTSSTGWRYKRIGDILPTTSFTAASQVYANANLG